MGRDTFKPPRSVALNRPGSIDCPTFLFRRSSSRLRRISAVDNAKQAVVVCDSVPQVGQGSEELEMGSALVAGDRRCHRGSSMLV